MTRVTDDGRFDDVEELRKRFEGFGPSTRSGRDSQKSYGGLPQRSRAVAARIWFVGRCGWTQIA